MILLAGGVPTEGDLIVVTIWAAVMSALIVALTLAILWGAACYWWREISDYWRWVRLSRRVRAGPKQCALCGSCGMERYCSRLECPGHMVGA